VIAESHVEFERQQGVAQHSFNSLMDLYEKNYIQMRRLVPELRQMQGCLISTVEGCLDLHLEVLEQHKYTTILRLSYHFLDQSGDFSRREPDVQIRIYHDARIAEVTSACLHRGLQARGPVRSRQGNWRLNRFLFKWLGFCLHRGHRFSR